MLDQTMNNQYFFRSHETKVKRTFTTLNFELDLLFMPRIGVETVTLEAFVAKKKNYFAFSMQFINYPTNRFVPFALD